MHRKIIRKVNDNDDGRAVGRALFGVRGSSCGNAGALMRARFIQRGRPVFGFGVRCCWIVLGR